MLEENITYLMNLFTIKGTRRKVPSRKEVNGEKVSSGIGAYKARPSAASSRRTSRA